MKCKECQTENIEGALFCEECGAKLEEEKSELIETEEGNDGANLVFTTAEGGTLDVPAKDEIVIGREDPISEVFPDLDLTEFGGLEKGVSRRHAVIHRSGAAYTLEDLGSTNGTFINKKRISPHAPEAIKAGDEVRFGKVTLSVKAA